MAYAIHILHNRHAYGTAEDTLQLLRSCNKGSQMNNWEAMLIQYHYHRQTLITEQLPHEDNILYRCMQAPWSDTKHNHTGTTSVVAKTSTEQ